MDFTEKLEVSIMPFKAFYSLVSLTYYLGNAEALKYFKTILCCTSAQSLKNWQHRFAG